MTGRLRGCRTLAGFKGAGFLIALQVVTRIQGVVSGFVGVTGALYEEPHP